MFIIPYKDTNLIALNLATKDAVNLTKENLARRTILAAITEMALNDKGDLHKNIFRSVISRFINKQIGAKEIAGFDFVASIERVGDQINVVNKYLGLAYSAAVIDNINRPEKYSYPDIRVISKV